MRTRWLGTGFALCSLHALSPACGGATKGGEFDPAGAGEHGSTGARAGEGGDDAGGRTTGGREPTGGTPPTGGRAPSGGEVATGGEAETGGRSPTGGRPATGGAGTGGATAGGTGGEPDLDACDSTSECVLVEPGCCRGCEPFRARDLAAVNRSYAPVLTVDCDVACEPCPDLEVEVPLYGNYFAACINHECEVIDVRETVATSCQSGADCHLRSGAACCPACDDTPIALRDDAFLEEMLECTTFEGCPECDPDLSGYAAVCEDEECRVVRQ